MDSHYAQPMPYPGQASFFYYSPDPAAEGRQHGHFTHQPVHQQMYSRPASSYQQQYGAQALMTPVQSPRPAYNKSAMLMQQESLHLFPLDTDCYSPSTPPLSASTSAVSSPPSSAQVLSTPLQMNFAQSFAGVKAGCEGEVFSEILAGEDWSHASPPMTPGKSIRVCA